MFFFKPRYVKDAEQLLHYARKLLSYKRDILSQDRLADFDTTMRDLREAAKARDEKRSLELMEHLTRQLELQSPPRHELSWRENVEVFVVAFIVAAGIRAYILQPFKIPTGSMQPTLNGIIVTPTNEALPNPVKRALDFALFGRSYFEVVSPVDDAVVNIVPTKISRFVDGSRLITRSGRTYDIPAPPNPFMEAFPAIQEEARIFMKAGEPYIRGYSTIGDHVFVDKVTYNFRRPQRDDVFVFLTRGIKRIESAYGTSGSGQFYIKRLVGLPGDHLRLVPPQLMVNGEVPDAFGIKRVISQKDGYGGYTKPEGSNPQPAGMPDSAVESRHGNSMIWVDGGWERTISKNGFFGMGDNSANSWDSRNWGEIPEQNAVGRGVFVWWPLSDHWGFVR